MKCNEFHECVCEIIDKRLPEDRVHELLEHAHKCPHCNYEYRALDLTKKIVHEKIRRISVPADIYYSIFNKTSGAQKGALNSIQQLFGTLFTNPAAVIVMLLVVAVGMYSIFIPQSNSLPDERNIISQSLKNYQAVIGGALKPQMEGNTDNVKDFLKKEVAFEVNVPKLTDCNSCAGGLSDYDGIKLAHVVYNVGGSVVYIYQADMDAAMKGNTIGLPDDARNELQKTDWYVHEFENGRTVVVWRFNNTLCAAVSDMDKKQLINLLIQKE